MEVAVIGVNPLGCTIACLLGAAGEDVSIVGGPERLSRITGGSITLRQLWDGRAITARVKTLEGLDHAPDVLVFATRAKEASAAAMGAKRYAGDATIATVQYGTKLDMLVAGYLKRDNIVSCVLTLGVACCSPGEVTLNYKGEMVIGRAYEAGDARVDQVVSLMSKAFVTHKRDKIAHFNCTGLLLSLPFAIPAVVGGSALQLFSDRDFARVAVMLLQEGMKVIDKSGVNREPLPDLGDGFLRGLLGAPAAEAEDLYSGMAMNAVRTPYYCPTSECVGKDAVQDVEYLNGELVKLADELGCGAPLNALMLELARRVESIGRFLDKREFLEEIAKFRYS